MSTILSPNVFKAIVRSLMPLVYSAAAAVIAHFGYHVSNSTVVQIVAAGFVVATAALHGLEARFPWVGVFLGWLGAPAYAPSVKKTQAAQIAELQAELAALKTPNTTS